MVADPLAAPAAAEQPVLPAPGVVADARPKFVWFAGNSLFVSRALRAFNVWVPANLYGLFRSTSSRPPLARLSEELLSTAAADATVDVRDADEDRSDADASSDDEEDEDDDDA